MRSVFSTAPWRRAPILLRRRPGVLASVAGASAVLAASVAGVPLFLSSGGSEAVAVQAGERCPSATGVSATEWFSVPGVEPPPVIDRDPERRPDPDAEDIEPPPVLDLDDPPGDPLAGLAGVGPRITYSDPLVELAVAESDGSGTTPVQLLARDGAFDHVEAVDGTPDGDATRGVWLGTRAADNAGLRRGDTVTFVYEDRFTTFGEEESEPVEFSLPVAGVYRDLTGTAADDDVWCSHTVLLQPPGPDQYPPPVILTDRATLVEVLQGLGVPYVPVTWEAPLATAGMTLAETDRLVDRLGCAGSDGAAGATGGSAAGEAGGRSWCAGEEAPPPGATGEERDSYVSETFATSLPFVTERARAIRTTVGAGVTPVAAFAAIAGVGLVGAAASLWFDRRRREVTILVVRGASPVAVGVKAVLELAPALIAGGLTGFGLAYGAVVWLGPSSAIESAATATAVAATLATVAVAALAVTAVVATRARGGLHGRAARRATRWVAAVPFELALVAAAVVSYRRLGEWGVPVSQGARVSRVDVVGLAFPVLFLLAGVAVLARALALGLRPLRSASEGWRTSLYLAVRRLVRYRAAMIGLVASAAIAAGVLGYAATLTRSLDATLLAKAKTFIGSDLALGLEYEAEVPDGLGGRATEVDTFRRVFAEVGGDDVELTLLAIDPATFAGAAYWDDSFSDESLDDLVDRLAAPPNDGNVPALVVGEPLPDIVDVNERQGHTSRFSIEQVADADTFPGMRRSGPTVFVAAPHLVELGVDGGYTEVWARGEPDETLAVMEASGVGFRINRALADVADRASFLTVAWTFDFSQALAVVAGLLVLGIVVVVLDARRRGRVLGYAFARRMGLSRAEHRRAVVAELVASVVVGCGAGLAIALGGAALTTRRIDPVPGYRPDPLLRPATVTIVAVLVVAVLVAGLGGALAQRRTDRDDPVEVLRAGV
ncbi:MAG TPA: hypothetical protein VKA65_14475 [Acidimicrobiales bacterium]|nr:hypothetical protein [Acidimicrobiales bacterium]